MNLIPMPKNITLLGGAFPYSAVKSAKYEEDKRIEKALLNLPQSENGAEIVFKKEEMDDEAYTLELSDKIIISAHSAKGVFYAIQTLRQLFCMPEIPKCKISDKPDFAVRGFYQDLTRGKVAKLETLKKLADKCAYFKINTIQLYVEHTFPFEEYKDVNEKFGYMTAEETREFDDYCYENFIELVPSLATFGHLYELLNQPKYAPLRILKDYKPESHYWWERQRHHTIDPRENGSFEMIKSLLDQYMPLFRSDKFNICCDETFDLDHCGLTPEDSGKIYIDFVCKIIDYVRSKGKTPMMWADILLQHPKAASRLPKDVQLLNWCYSSNPDEKTFKTIASMNRTQIACPGTSSWSSFCEMTDIANDNIVNMAYYAKKYNAAGILNTNWGDIGNVCSIALAMHGLALGAEQSWTATKTMPSDFDSRLNALVYQSENGSDFVNRIGKLCLKLRWLSFIQKYSDGIYGKSSLNPNLPDEDTIRTASADAAVLKAEIESDGALKPAYKKEMILAVEAQQILARFFAKLIGCTAPNAPDVKEWLSRYKEAWLSKNKPSELDEIERVFLDFDQK